MPRWLATTRLPRPTMMVIPWGATTITELCRQRAAIQPVFDVMKHDVQAELRRRADDERQAPDVCQIDLKVEGAHESDRPQQADDQRHQGEQGLGCAESSTG